MRNDSVIRGMNGVCYNKNKMDCRAILHRIENVHWHKYCNVLLRKVKLSYWEMSTRVPIVTKGRYTLSTTSIDFWFDRERRHEVPLLHNRRRRWLLSWVGNNRRNRQLIWSVWKWRSLVGKCRFISTTTTGRSNATSSIHFGSWNSILVKRMKRRCQSLLCVRILKRYDDVVFLSATTRWVTSTTNWWAPKQHLMLAMKRIPLWVLMYRLVMCNIPHWFHVDLCEVWTASKLEPRWCESMDCIVRSKRWG